MDKRNELITDIYKKGIVKKYLKRYFNEDYDNLRDLEQDIYVLLLRLPVDILEEMYENGKIEHWIAATVKNQVRSVTSTYYKKYKEFIDKSSEIYENTTDESD